MALDQILAHKREEVAARAAANPLDGILARVNPSDRSLTTALARPHTGFILEFKTASPSRGVIAAQTTADQIARAYGPFADAISVLTDERFFGGSLQRLTEVRGLVSQPVLCKDFVVDPWQIAAARAAGADAILLMLSVLDDSTYRKAAELAQRLNMAVLTEVHSEAELSRAVSLDAAIIGINNRDLQTLKIDMTIVPRLAPKLPDDRLVIAESGYQTHTQIKSAANLVDGFLVGTSLMSAPSLEVAVREMIFGITKVCGLTRPSDASIAWALGATHGGVIFAPESPRYVELAEAHAIVNAAPMAWVGVFVNAESRAIAFAVKELGLAAVQLHGEESRAQVMELRNLLGADCQIWKAVRVKDRIPTLEETGADHLVLDTFVAGSRGGTGRRFDWSLLAAHPATADSLLSGGLNPKAVMAAERVGCWGLDVNSGVESAPGCKDPILLSEFFEARRGKGRNRESSHEA